MNELQEKLSPKQIGHLKTALDTYISEHDDPNIEGFCSQYRTMNRHITPKYLHGIEQLKPLLEWGRTKEEAYLISQKDRPVMAIFRLKQPKFGYQDTASNKTEVNVTFSNALPRPQQRKVDSKASSKD